MKTAGKIFVGIAVLGISGFGYALGPHVAGDFDAFMLRRHAESACRCERHGGPTARQTCWADFEKELAARHAQPGLHSFCEAIIRPEPYVWTENGSEHRISKRYTTDVLPAGPLILCSRREAGAVEEAVSKDWDQHGRITPATEKLIRDIVRDDAYTPPLFDAPLCG